MIIRNEGRNEAKVMKWGLVPSWVYTFTIITSHANALLRRIHHRMPVMYRRDMGKQWLEAIRGRSGSVAHYPTSFVRGN